MKSRNRVVFSLSHWLVVLLFLSGLAAPASAQLATDPWLIPFTASGRILSSPAASPSELTIYFGDNSGVLYAVDPKFESIIPGNPRPPIPTNKWSFATGRSFFYSSPTVAQNGTVYAASSALFALNNKGTQLWKFTFPNGVGASSNSSPAIGIDGVIYMASEDDRLYAVRDRGNTFELAWPQPFVTSTNNGFRNMIASSPSVSTDGSIYFVTEQDILFALRPNGTEKWRKVLNNSGVNAPGELASSVAIGKDGTLYVGSKGSGLYAIRDAGTTSVEKWRFDPGDNVWFVASPAVGFNENIYVSTIDGRFYALSNGVSSATPLPGFPRYVEGANKVVRSSAAIDKNGVAYVGTISGKLFGIMPDGSDANFLVNYPYTTSGPIMSSPTILSDGLKAIVVFGSEDGGLYAAYASGSLASLNNAAWPMFRKDLSHSASGSTSAPSIIQHPADQSVMAGGRVEFTVETLANPSPFYQWRKGGIPIPVSQNPTATAKTLVIASANPGDAGTGEDGYDVVVSNSAGTVTSKRASLILSSAPEILIDPLAVKETFEDTASEEIRFYVGDLETAAANLSIRVVSANQTLVPEAGIKTGFGAPDGSIRTVIVTPGTNQFGTTVLTAYIKDEDGVEVGAPFSFLVRPRNDLPFFDPIPDQVIAENSSKTITISNIFSGPANERDQYVILSARSDRPDLVLNPVVAPSQLNTNVHETSLTLTTVPGANGVALITVTAQDSTATNIFVPGFSLTTNRSFFVTIGAINDAPVLLLSTNRYFGREDTSISLAGIRVADPDAGTGQLTLRLQSTNGAIAFGLETGLTYLQGTANRQSNVFVSGTLAALNTALTSLNYLGAKDSSAPDRIVLTVDDQGNTGTGGARQETKSVDISLEPVNDPPAIGRVAAQTLAPGGRINVRVQVTDVDNPPAALTLVASSGDSDIIPPPLVFRDENDPTLWTVQLVSSGREGTTSISLLAGDGTASTSLPFVVTVQTTNTLPLLAQLPSIVILTEDTTTNLVFAVADAETPPAALSVQVTSSNPTLFPPGSLSVTTTSGSTRGLALTPSTNAFGNAVLSFVVGDGVAFTTNRVDVNVLSANDLPTAVPIPDMVVSLNLTTNAVFRVSDVETPAAALAVQVTSSNPSVLPNNPLVGVLGNERSIRIAPSGQPGTAVLTVVVTDADSGQASFTFRVTVSDPIPVILQHPANATAVSGSTANFSVTAAGDPPLRYQWKFQGVDIFGATNAVLNLPSVTPASAGAYSVGVSNLFGGKISNPATLTVLTPPFIVTQPESQTVRSGTPVNFIVLAEGTRPLSYQWLKNGTPLSGATNTSLLITSATSAEAGRYSLLITNVAGSVTSREAVLALNTNTPPRISDILGPFQVPEGASVGPFSFTVQDSETPSQLVVTASSSNQELVGDGDISLTTSGFFRFVTIKPKAGRTGDVTITLTVRDPDGATASDSFQIVVQTSNTPPTIQDLGDVRTDSGVPTPSITFNVRDNETSASDLIVTARSSNQQLLPDSAIALGGQGIFRTVTLRPAAGEVGTATVTLTVSDGKATATDTFILTVVRPLLPPVFLVQPPSTLVTNVGANIVVSAQVGGSDPLTYQWRFGTNPILGATSPNLVLTNLQIAQSGTYTLLVTNPVASVVSTDFKLTVAAEKQPPTVSLLQPTNNASFTAGERVIFSASANDADGLVTKVGFLVGATLIGEDTSSPYNTNAVLTVPGTYTVRAVATDNEGFETFSEPVTIEVKPAVNLPTISITDVPGEEGNSGFKNFVFRLSLSSASELPVSVQFSTASDTAVGRTDFVETNGVVQFAPGVRSGTITVQVLGDTVPDGDNETFFVNLSSPQNALLADSQGIGTIQDDENPIFISITDAGVTEGNSGTNSLVFTIQLSEPSPQEVSVEYATANGTALAGQDYVNRAGRVVFPAGVTSVDVRVPVIPDLIQEPTKTMTLKLSNPANSILFPGEEEGTGTITDDDAPPVARIEDLTLVEGNAGTTEANVTVNLTSASATAVSVDFTTVDGTAQSALEDYKSASGTLVFAPGIMSQTIRVAISADTLHEPDESFLVRISNPTNTTIVRAEATVRVTNDDLPPTLSIVGRNVIEGNAGTVDAVFTVLLSTPSGQNVTVDYGTRNASAIAGLDYQRVSGTLVFLPGETTKTISVPVIGDVIDEPRETFEVVLDNPLNASISEGTGTCGITDDDAGPTIQIADAQVVEGSSGTTNAVFVVTLANVSGQQVSVSYSTTDLLATVGLDYISANGTVTFTPGVTNRTISIPVLGDILSETNETFQVRLTSPVNGTISRDTAIGIIVDDDAAPALRVEDVQFEEGNAGPAPANAVVRLTSASSQPISVAYRIETVSATEGEDFTATSGTLTFEPGTASKSIPLTIQGDTLDEPNETFRILLSNSVNATIDRAEALGTIIDDDLAPTLSVVGRNVIEGNTGFTNIIFTVTLSTPSGQQVTVEYATQDVTATAGQDYTETRGTVTFPAGETVRTIPVPVAGDLSDEPRETFQLRLSNPINATVTEDTATGAILNDDVRPTLSVTDATVTETESTAAASLQVTLSSVSGQTVTVRYFTVDGSATAGSDYTFAEGTLTFSPGEASKTISIGVLGDSAHESQESFTVILTNGVNANIVRSQALVNILDNDELPSFPPSIGPVADQSAVVNGTVTVPVVLTDPDTPLSQLVLKASSDNAALIGSAGIVVSGTDGNRAVQLTPIAGQTGSAVITLTVDDGRNQGTRSFRLTVTNPDTPPVILTQPVSRTVLLGTTVSFSVSAAGSPPLSFQWMVNGTNLAGANASTLQFDAVQGGDAGEYSVRVSNSSGSVTSSNATLVVGRLGAKLWDYQIGKPIRTSVAIGPDGSLYVGADDGKLHSLTHDGVLRWSFASGAEIYSSPAIGADGSVYFGSFDHKVYALAKDGSKRWEFSTGAEIYSSPAIGADGTVYIGSYDSKFYAIKPDGTLKWEFLTGNTIASSPSIAADGTIYFGSQDRKLYALNPDGTKKWEFTANADIISSPSIARDGTIYFGSLDKRLYALRPDGTLIWQFTAINAIRSSPGIGEDGTLYFGTDDGRLYAVGADGRKKWDVTTGVLIFSSPAVGVDGTIYVGSFDRKLYAFNPNGSRKWEFSTEGEVYSSPALDRDGVVFLGSLDGRVYAIKGTTGLADTAWPMFRKSLDHTARVPSSGLATAPVLNQIEFAGNVVRIQWATESGKTYQVESSADLTTWSALASVTATGTSSEYVDRSALQEQRYYRISVR